MHSDENLNISERTLLVDMCDKSALKFGIPALHAVTFDKHLISSQKSLVGIKADGRYLEYIFIFSSSFLVECEWTFLAVLSELVKDSVHC